MTIAKTDILNPWGFDPTDETMKAMNRKEAESIAHRVVFGVPETEPERQREGVLDLTLHFRLDRPANLREYGALLGPSSRSSCRTLRGE